jgi:hypothetical protein
MDDNKKRALAAAWARSRSSSARARSCAWATRWRRSNHRHRLAHARHRARHRRPAQGSRGRDLRPGILRQDHAHPADHRRVPEGRWHRAFIDAEHALDPTYAQKLGVNVDELLPLAAGYRRTGAGDRRHAGAFQRGRHGGGRLGRRAHAQGRDRGRDGRPAPGPAGAPDEPGAAQAHRQHQAQQLHGDLHQPAAHEDRRDDARPEQRK